MYSSSDLHRSGYLWSSFIQHNRHSYPLLQCPFCQFSLGLSRLHDSVATYSVTTVGTDKGLPRSLSDTWFACPVDGTLGLEARSKRTLLPFLLVGRVTIIDITAVSWRSASSCIRVCSALVVLVPWCYGQTLRCHSV